MARRSKRVSKQINEDLSSLTLEEQFASIASGINPVNSANVAQLDANPAEPETGHAEPEADISTHAPSLGKRYHYKSIFRQFIIGSHAWVLDEETRSKLADPKHTHGWKIFLRPKEGDPCPSWWLKKVQFKIHQDYANPLRTCEEPPFEVQETGWGEFDVEVRLHCIEKSGERTAAKRSFRLRLHPYGEGEQRRMQIESGKVDNENFEEIIWEAPYEAFYDHMTNPAQFDTAVNKDGFAEAVKGKGKGKAKGGSKQANYGGRKGGAGQMNGDDAEERSFDLPEHSTPTNPYSKQTERALLDVIRAAQQEVDRQTNQIKDGMTEKEAELEKLKEQNGGVVPPATAVKKK